MLETEDPRVALRSKDLPTQAAAARDLALMGTWDDVEALVELASSHRRTGMRLSAAAAAADILHRYRTGAAGEPLGKVRTEQVIEWARRTDPGENPSMLMLLAAIPNRTVIERLGRLLKDPRNDVRMAAAVALRRMSLSHTDLDAAALRKAIGTWLGDRRSPADALAELARLVGDLGWTEHTDAVRNLSGTGAVREAVHLALERQKQREHLSGWSGVYVSDGLDVLEQDLEPREGAWLLLHDGHVATADRPATPLTFTNSRVTGGPLTDARLIWAPRLGRPSSGPALQIPGRTWHRLQEPQEIIDFMLEHSEALGRQQHPASGALTASLADAEGAAGARAQAIALVLGGDASAGAEALTALMTGKKPRADLFLWRARAHEALGDTASAIADYTGFLERAGQRAEGRDVAVARLAALTA